MGWVHRWMVSLLVVLLTWSSLLAQPDTIPMVLSTTESSLTLYIDKHHVDNLSLSELGFRWSARNQNQVIYLRDFSALLPALDDPPVPLCLQLSAPHSSDPLPLSCQDASLLVHRVSQADVFWWDSLTNQQRTLQILNDDTVVGLCGASSTGCEIDYPEIIPLDWDTLIPIIEQDFDDVEDTEIVWEQGETIWIEYYQNGVLHFRNTSNEDSPILSKPATYSGEASDHLPIAVDVQISALDESISFSGAGLFYRSDEEYSNYYGYMLTVSGRVVLFRGFSGPGTFDTLYSSQPENFNEDGFNRLGIAGNGPCLDLFLNNIWLNTYCDDEDAYLVGRTSGLFSFSIGDYAFDNRTIYEPPRSG